MASTPISRVVEVDITRSTLSVSQTEFDVALILGPNLLSDSRVNYFAQTDLPTLAKQLAGGTDAPEYMAAAAYFAQSPCPTQVAIGRMTGTQQITISNCGSPEIPMISGRIYAQTKVMQYYYDCLSTDTLQQAIQNLTNQITSATITVAASGNDITITSSISMSLDISQAVAGYVPAYTIQGITDTNLSEEETRGALIEQLIATVADPGLMDSTTIYFSVNSDNGYLSTLKGCEGTFSGNDIYQVSLHIGGTIAYFGEKAGTLSSADIAYTLDPIEEVKTALANCQIDDSGWYGIIPAWPRTSDTLLAAMDWAQSNEKILFVNTMDPNVVGLSDGDDSGLYASTLAGKAKAKSYDRIALIYNGLPAKLPADGIYGSPATNADAPTAFADAALFGQILWRNPGSYTAMFKQLVGITADSLNATQLKNAEDKYVNTYVNIAGVNMVSRGTVASSEYIDVMIFIDWLKARIAEAVFGDLARAAGKIPYEAAGLAIVENAIRRVLALGQRYGGISETAYDTDGKRQIGGFYIIMPNLADIPDNDKANRTLTNVQFVAFLAGAIQHVQIMGNVKL